MQHKIPLCILLASCVIVPKRDIREHLTFVKVQNGYVNSTDGYRAFMCKVDGLDENFDLFILPEHIQSLAKTLSAKDKRNTKLEVSIEVKQDGDEQIIIMQCKNAQIKYLYQPPKDKYPDISRAIPTDEVDCMLDFNWSLLVDMSKIAKLLGSDYQARVIPSGKNKPARIDFNCKFEATGIVMPIRE